jgi:protein-tyrosine phosphatase
MIYPNNFRDVGYAINQTLGEPMLKQHCLYRSGEFDTAGFLTQHRFNTVLSLRRAKDPTLAGVEFHNVAPLEKMNNYQHWSAVFEDWFTRFIHLLVQVEAPILIHCTAGKDRTGVAVALLLKLLGVPTDSILQEYSLSEGVTYPESLSALLGEYQFPGDVLESRSQLREKFNQPI